MELFKKFIYIFYEKEPNNIFFINGMWIWHHRQIQAEHF